MVAVEGAFAIIIHMPRQPSLSSNILQAALAGLELQRQRIDEQIAEVRARLGQKRRGRPPKDGKKAAKASAEKAAPAPVKKKRTMSAAARKKISAAQKKRWAEWNKAARKGKKK